MPGLEFQVLDRFYGQIHLDILNQSAFSADEMRMWFQPPIKPVNPANAPDSPYLALFLQDLQVPVHRSLAQGHHPRPEGIIQPFCRGMISDRLQ